MLMSVVLFHFNIKRHYAEWCFADCRGAIPFAIFFSKSKILYVFTFLAINKEHNQNQANQKVSFWKINSKVLLEITISEWFKACGVYSSNHVLHFVTIIHYRDKKNRLHSYWNCVTEQFEICDATQANIWYIMSQLVVKAIRKRSKFYIKIPFRGKLKLMLLT